MKAIGEVSLGSGSFSSEQESNEAFAQLYELDPELHEVISLAYSMGLMSPIRDSYVAGRLVDQDPGGIRYSGDGFSTKKTGPRVSLELRDYVDSVQTVAISIDPLVVRLEFEVVEKQLQFEMDSSGRRVTRYDHEIQQTNPEAVHSTALAVVKDALIKTELQPEPAVTSYLDIE